MGIHSIRVRVAAVLVVTLALILGLQILYVTPTIRRQIVEEAMRTQVDLARQVAGHLELVFQRAAAELEAVARLPPMRSMDKFQIDDILEDMDQISPFFDYHFVLDRNGVWVSYPSRPELVGQRVSAQNLEWLSPAMTENRTVFLDVLVFQENALVSGFVTPIRDQAGVPVGLLRGVFVISAPNVVLATIEQTQLGENGYAYLVAQNGHLLAHPHTWLTVEDYEAQDYSSYEPIARVIRGEMGMVEYEYEGETWIATYQPLKATGWGLIVHQPKRDILSLARGKVAWVLVAQILALGLSAVTVLLIIQRAFRPLSQLVEDMRAGKMSPGKSRRGDEIGHLAHEFGALYTELLHSKEALQVSEQRYRQLVDLAPAGIYEVDLATGRFVSVNDVMCAYTGYSKKELMAMRADALLTTGDQAAFQERMACWPAQDPGPSTSEYQVVSKSGRLFWALLNVNARQEQGHAIATIVAHDISEHKRVDLLLKALNQTALATSQAQTPQEIFELVARELDKLGLFCLIFEPDQDRTRLYVRYLNYDPRVMRALQRWGGFEADRFFISIAQGSIYEAVTFGRETVFVPNALELIGQILPPRANRLAQHIGHVHAVPQAIMAPLIAREQVIGVLAVQSSDLRTEDMPAITAFANQVAATCQKAGLMQDLERSLQELQETQQQLIQAQKMEAIGRLAGGVAHDFNNILTAIIGYADMVLMELSPEQAAYSDIQEIARAAERAASLTHQLLAFSRRQVLQPVILNLNGVITHIDRMLRRLIGENVQLRLLLDPELGNVRADQTQIEQVIVNLAVNARDAMSYGGQLTIETANVDLDEHYVGMEPGAYVQLSISDTGMGMDKEILSHLFEPFFTTKDQSKGVGLGLAMVYGIVVQSGGHIYPYSELGHGTTIKIYLPRVTEQAPVQASTGHAPLPQGTESILVVEDEDLVRELAVRVLKQQGYTLLEARGPYQALDLCTSLDRPLDLLISDVIMPQMGGPDLAIKVTSMFDGVKVLFISGYTDNAIAHQGMLDPGLHFMQKPFTPLALARKVREVLDEVAP